MSTKYIEEAGSSPNVNNCEQDYYYGILHKRLPKQNKLQQPK